MATQEEDIRARIKREEAYEAKMAARSSAPTPETKEAMQRGNFATYEAAPAEVHVEEPATAGLRQPFNSDVENQDARARAEEGTGQKHWEDHHRHRPPGLRTGKPVHADDAKTRARLAAFKQHWLRKSFQDRRAGKPPRTMPTDEEFLREGLQAQGALRAPWISQGE